MPVCLVSYIPYQLIVWRVVNVMKRYGQFNHTQAGCKMASMYTYYINDVLPQFITELM